MTTAYLLGLALGALGSLVVGAATVLSAVYLRKLLGYPFSVFVEAEAVEKQLRHYVTTGRSVTVCREMPNGYWFISGR